jgi:hypothetical protein
MACKPLANVIQNRASSEGFGSTITEQFDMDQRLVGMYFTAGVGELTVTVPFNADIAPPGYYMLFLVNNSGVPSVGFITHLN